MKIKIISDGMARNTTIVDAENGEKVEGIRSAKWKCSVKNGLAKATLEFIAIPVEIHGELDITELGDKWKRKLPPKEVNNV